MLPRPFNPHYGSNSALTLAAGVQQTIAINAPDASVRVVNAAGGALLYFRTFNSAEAGPPVASAIDCPVLPGMATVVSKDLSHDRISLISATGTTCDVMTGNSGV